MSQNNIKVIDAYDIGSKVEIAETAMIGKITGILINHLDDDPEYRVVWWNKNERKSDWLSHSELKLVVGEPRRIGFRI